MAPHIRNPGSFYLLLTYSFHLMFQDLTVPVPAIMSSFQIASRVGSRQLNISINLFQLLISSLPTLGSTYCKLIRLNMGNISVVIFIASYEVKPYQGDIHRQARDRKANLLISSLLRLVGTFCFTDRCYKYIHSRDQSLVKLASMARYYWAVTLSKPKTRSVIKQTLLKTKITLKLEI